MDHIYFFAHMLHKKSFTAGSTPQIQDALCKLIGNLLQKSVFPYFQMFLLHIIHLTVISFPHHKSSTCFFPLCTDRKGRQKTFYWEYQFSKKYMCHTHQCTDRPSCNYVSINEPTCNNCYILGFTLTCKSVSILSRFFSRLLSTVSCLRSRAISDSKPSSNRFSTLVGVSMCTLNKSKPISLKHVIKK